MTSSFHQSPVKVSGTVHTNSTSVFQGQTSLLRTCHLSSTHRKTTHLNSTTLCKGGGVRAQGPSSLCVRMEGGLGEGEGEGEVATHRMDTTGVHASAGTSEGWHKQENRTGTWEP